MKKTLLASAVLLALSTSAQALTLTTPTTVIQDDIEYVTTGSNALNLYAPLSLTGKNVTISSKYNAVQGGEGSTNKDSKYGYNMGNGELTIVGENVTVSTEQHIALHSAWGADISITADNLTINSPKAIQTMHTTGNVALVAKKADINGDICAGGENNTISVSIEEGNFTGRVMNRSDNDGTTLVTLDLGEKAAWILTNGNLNNYGSGEAPFYGAGEGDSTVAHLNVEGTIDMSQADRNIFVTKSLTGESTVVLDAAKANKLDASAADATKASVTVLTSKNADEVSETQAAALLDRIVGVEDKTAFVEEGQVGGSIVVGADGKVQQAVNAKTEAFAEQVTLAPQMITRIMMNDVRKRMGDLRAAEGTHGVWARYNGGQMSGQGMDADFHMLQVGIDTVPVADAPRFGVAFSYAQTEADATNGLATTDMDSFSLAFYGTKMYDNGMFVDVIGRMATLDTEMNVGGNKAEMDNVALSLSGELGWRFDVTDRFFFEPSVEATYTYTNADTFKMGQGTYELESVDSLVGRAGFAAGFKCPANKGDIYVRAAVVHEFMGDSTMNSWTAAGNQVAPVVMDGKDTWFEYAIGAQFNVNKSTYVYADVERTEGATMDEDWRANVGVRFAF